MNPKIKNYKSEFKPFYALKMKTFFCANDKNFITLQKI